MAKSLGIALLAAMITSVVMTAFVAWQEGYSFRVLIEVTGIPAFIVGSVVIIVWKLIESHCSKKKELPRGFEVIFNEQAENKGD